MSLTTAASAAEKILELITLRVAGKRLGVEIGHVTEISTRLRPFPAPVTTPHIAGVLNLRGEVVTVLKLDVILGVERRRESAVPPKYVLLRCGDERAAVEVDDVEDVQEVPAASIRPLPDNIGRKLSAVTDGVLPQENGMLLTLNVAKLFDLDDGGRR